MSLAAESNRGEFLKQVSSAALAFGALSSSPNAANAAKYGGFGAGSPEVLDPKEAIVDDEILASDAVQKALSGVKETLATVKEMQACLAADPQADIGPIIRKKLDFVAVRTDLNTFNSAFDEDTQRGTDRVIRLIMQDITELEVSNKQKPGVPRSTIRLANMNGKLDKLIKAFEDLLAFV